METMIQFCDIEKRYGDKRILNNFDLSIEKGDFLSVIGSSGCGKTTLLKMINGLIKPEAGTIKIEGKNIKDMNLIELRRSIGYCIQGNILFPHMSVEENIAYVPNLTKKQNVKELNDMMAKWMKIVDLNESMRTRYPSELSGGQQQRVGIARALAASPKILLMDEPFSSVDEITRKQLQKEMKLIHEQTKITVVFVTHDISEALYLGSKVLVLDKGKIQQYDTPEKICREPNNEFVSKLLNQNH